MRKRARYKELVQELKLAREHADQNLIMEELSSSQQPSLCDTFEVIHEGRRRLIPRVLRVYQQGPRTRMATVVSTRARSGLKTVVPIPESSLFRDTVRNSGRPELQNWRDPQLNGRQRKQVRYHTTQEWRRTD